MNKPLSISNVFGKLTIIFILAGLLLNFFFEGRFGYVGLRKYFLAFALIFYALKLLTSKKIFILNDFFVYGLLAVPIMILSVGFWFSLAEINVYLTLIITIIIITSDFEFFKKCIIVVIYILLVLVVYEFITKSYVFIVYRETEWGLKPLDVSFYGGYAKIFRAKGLFEGPLALAQFAIGSAFVFRDNLKIILISILFSILANGRLGVVLSSSILILYFVNKYNLIQFFKSKKGLRILFGIILLFLFFGPYLITEKTIERFNKIFSSKDSGNDARLYYWEKAIDMFGDYNIFHKIFGNSGYYRELIGNSAENGWLMLLLNNGIIGFLYYFLPIMLIMVMSMSVNRINFAYMLLLVLSMIIQTFHLGALASLFYWIIIYSFYIELKKTPKYEVID